MYASVLVAHNGYSFNFPVLLAEVERRPRDLAGSSFVTKNIHFSDTLPLLRKEKKDGEKCLVGTKLGMKVLYKHILKTDLPGTVKCLRQVS